MPFCQLTLRAKRRELDTPEPSSFAGRIRWRRKKLGLTQRELADRLGVTAETVRNWELGHSRPGFRNALNVVNLLNFPNQFVVPGTQTPRDFPNRFAVARRRLGLSQAEAAARIGVTADTISEWENGHHEPSTRYRQAIQEFLEEALGGSLSPAAQRIRSIRKSLGLTQPEFAERVGVHPKTVSKWETGVQEPDYERVRRVEGLLGEQPSRPCP